MEFVDKRSFVRVKVNMPVDFQYENKSSEPAQALALNISVEGICLMSKGISLTVGQIIKIKLSGEWSNIVLAAQVVRQEKDYYACQFVDLSSETGKTLDEKIYKLWRQSIRVKPGKENKGDGTPDSRGLNVFI